MSFFFEAGLLHWQILFLLVINGLITFIAIVNALYLNNSFSKLALCNISNSTSVLTLADSKKIKVHARTTMESTLSIITLSPNTPKKMQYQSFNKNRVIKYFKITPWIPLLISYVSFYGAVFPENAIWIIPFLNITIGFIFLLYIQIIIISCDGWFILQHYLQSESDRCCVAKKRKYKMRVNRNSSLVKSNYSNRKKQNGCCCCYCCIQADAYLGLKFKIKLCYLILLQPILNYCTAYFQYYYNISSISYILNLLTIVTSGIIPITLIVYIHNLLKPYSKISNTNIKLMIVIWLSPLCQLQQSFISFLFDIQMIPAQNSFINPKLPCEYEWPCLYGLVICIEMLIISIIITWKVFPATDLILWDRLDALMRQRGNSEVSINVGVTVMESDTEGSP